MKRPWFLVVLILALAGCASRKPYAPDAFFGRTAIPPPATGSALASRHAPYYAGVSENNSPIIQVEQPAQRLAAHENSAWQSTADVRQSANAPASPSPSSTNQIAAHWLPGSTGSADIRTRIRPPDYAASTNQPVNAPANSNQIAAPSSTSTATQRPRQPIVSILQPRATPASRQLETIAATTPSTSAGCATTIASSWSSPTSECNAPTTSIAPRCDAACPDRPTIRPSRFVEIGDLPDVGTRAARTRRMDNQVQQASATVAMGGRTPQTNASGPSTQPSNTSGWSNANGSTPSLRYGHDPAYAWLRGRLEYSDVAKRWKLRYIPINGETDRFGGSVVLGETTLLADLEQGDFVEIRGRLLTGENGHWGYAPVYEVAQLRPIGK
ncbi:MAG: hypothetical protein JW719_07055 [Pirellulales bacterium]|nr:hypothetical protein [Pirellulales bacterium]